MTTAAAKTAPTAAANIVAVVRIDNVGNSARIVKLSRKCHIDFRRYNIPRFLARLICIYEKFARSTFRDLYDFYRIISCVVGVFLNVKIFVFLQVL